MTDLTPETMRAMAKSLSERVLFSAQGDEDAQFVRAALVEMLDVGRAHAVAWNADRKRIATLEKELRAVLDVAIARGESLGYVNDDDYEERRATMAADEETP